MRRDLFTANRFDRNLEVYLRSIITGTQYHEFTDIIVEIMLRRQSEFNLPYDRIIREAQNLVRTLPVIEVVPNSQLSNPRWAAQSGPDGIKIGFDSYKHVLNGRREAAEDLYETLTHEVYHSIAMHDRGGTGVSNNKFRSRGLNELINEAAANRAARNYSSHERRIGIRDTQGYSNLTKFSPVLARCFGLTEKEFLAAGISYQGEFALRDLLLRGTQTNDPRINEIRKNRAENLIVSMSYQVELLHNIDTPMDRSQELPNHRKPEYRSAALSGLVNSMIDMAIFRIENSINLPNPIQVEEHAFTYKSITGFVTEILNQYQNDGLISRQQADTIKRESYTRLYELAKRVVGVKEASEAIRRGIDPNAAAELSFIAKTGNLMTSYQANRFGIPLPSNLYQAVYNIDTSIIHNEVLRQDFAGRYWENDPACEEVRKIFEIKSRYLRPDNQEQKQSFFDRIKAFFQRLAGNQQQQLPGPKHMRTEPAPPMPDIQRMSRVRLAHISPEHMRNPRPGSIYNTPPEKTYSPTLDRINQERLERTNQFTRIVNTMPDGLGAGMLKVKNLEVAELHTNDNIINKQDEGR